MPPILSRHKNGLKIVNFKWVVIGKTTVEKRYEYLSEALSHLGVINEVSFIKSSQESFSDDVKRAMLSFDSIRVEEPFCNKLPDCFEGVPSQIMIIKSADAVIKDLGRWWPRSLLGEGLRRAIIHSKIDIDYTGLGLLIGSGGGAREAMNGLVQLGLSGVHISGSNQIEVSKFFKDLKRSYFGMRLEIIPTNELTMLPGHYSLIVNTILSDNDDILNELYYFNFLKKGGLVVDLKLSPEKSNLIKEAESINAKIITGYEVESYIDDFWVESCFKKKLDIIPYIQGLRSLFA